MTVPEHKHLSIRTFQMLSTESTPPVNIISSELLSARDQTYKTTEVVYIGNNTWIHGNMKYISSLKQNEIMQKIGRRGGGILLKGTAPFFTHPSIVYAWFSFVYMKEGNRLELTLSACSSNVFTHSLVLIVHNLTKPSESLAIKNT